MGFTSFHMAFINPLAINSKSLGLGIAFGFIFSLGPLIYAYLIRSNFWLKTHLSTGLTHELKSPLNTIQSAIEVLAEEASFQETRPEVREYIQLIKTNSTRLEEYIHDLLNLAKIQQEEVRIERNSFNLSLALEEICSTYRSLAQKNKILIETKIHPNIYVEGDVAKIKQTTSNLLSNAIKFSSEGTVKVTLAIQNHEALFTIKDKGIGINKKDTKKIFDRFYQNRPNTKGSEIGLTIAKAWIEAHGGKIWAESEGRGTKIIFTLPVSP